MERKGIFGMDMVMSFVMGILILTVVAFAGVIALTELNESAAGVSSQNTTLQNETITFVAAGNDTSVSNLRNVALSNVIITNATGGEEVPANNYSISGGTVTPVGNSSYLNLLVNVSATVSFETLLADGVVSNTTSGYSTLFSSAGTWFSLLAVVVIILIVVVVILAVNRFSGAKGDFKG